MLVVTVFISFGLKARDSGPVVPETYSDGGDREDVLFEVWSKRWRARWQVPLCFPGLNCRGHDHGPLLSTY